jgi:hypothetical protein
MKIMFDGLDRSFGLPNLRYGREAREVLGFTKHHIVTIYIEREREREEERKRLRLWCYA